MVSFFRKFELFEKISRGISFTGALCCTIHRLQIIIQSQHIIYILYINNISYSMLYCELSMIFDLCSLSLNPHQYICSRRHSHGLRHSLATFEYCLFAKNPFSIESSNNKIFNLNTDSYVVVYLDGTILNIVYDDKEYYIFVFVSKAGTRIF